MNTIHMVDLQTQYRHIQKEVQAALDEILETSTFINGPAVTSFARNLEAYLGVKHVVPCANGTDALQVAMMALGLQPGDEVIVPTFTYIATVEVIALLRLKPVLADVNPRTFNLDVSQVEGLITEKTKAIVPVHLFGQCADMAPLLDICQRHNLFLIEDTAQAIGARYRMPDGSQPRAGTMGNVGTTSFYPSKNLGCYGDGGAMMTQDDAVAEELRTIANHGQKRRYYFDRVGVNSRLDSIQAAILDIKLRHLDEYNRNRQRAAAYYDQAFANLAAVEIPYRAPYSDHVFHQYTLKVAGGKRDALQWHLTEKGIPSVVFYPLSVHQQTAYQHYGYREGQFPVAEQLGREVLSLPMHSELSEDQLAYIAGEVRAFFGA